MLSYSGLQKLLDMIMLKSLEQTGSIAQPPPISQSEQSGGASLHAVKTKTKPSTNKSRNSKSKGGIYQPWKQENEGPQTSPVGQEKPRPIETKTETIKKDPSSPISSNNNSFTSSLTTNSDLKAMFEQQKMFANFHSSMPTSANSNDANRINSSNPANNIFLAYQQLLFSSPQAFQRLAQNSANLGAPNSFAPNLDPMLNNWLPGTVPNWNPFSIPQNHQQNHQQTPTSKLSPNSNISGFLSPMKTMPTFMANLPDISNMQPGIPGSQSQGSNPIPGNQNQTGLITSHVKKMQQAQMPPNVSVPSTMMSSKLSPVQSLFTPSVLPGWPGNPMQATSQFAPGQASNPIFNPSCLQNFDVSGGLKPAMTLGNQGEKGACQCPNCVQSRTAQFLGIVPSGDSANRKPIHSCHIAGCGKTYTKTSHLKAHLRWHTGERPFVCNWLFCGKRFARAEHLHNHMKLHTGKEPVLSCHQCKETFAQTGELEKHAKICQVKSTR